MTKTHFATWHQVRGCIEATDMRFNASQNCSATKTVQAIRNQQPQNATLHTGSDLQREHDTTHTQTCSQRASRCDTPIQNVQRLVGGCSGIQTKQQHRGRLTPRTRNAVEKHHSCDDPEPKSSLALQCDGAACAHTLPLLLPPPKLLRWLPASRWHKHPLLLMLLL